MAWWFSQYSHQAPSLFRITPCLVLDFPKWKKIDVEGQLDLRHKILHFTFAGIIATLMGVFFFFTVPNMH